MRLVVDASVAVKWLVVEPHSQYARELLAPRIVLHAPDFILTEVANVIWKKARRKEIPSRQPYIGELANLTDAVALQPSTELVIKAAALAVQIDHPVYDCVYLACAEALAAPLVTADERLAQRVGERCPTVEVWNIGDPEIARRIATAATALVIQDDTVQRTRGRLASRSRRCLLVGPAAASDAMDVPCDMRCESFIEIGLTCSFYC